MEVGIIVLSFDLYSNHKNAEAFIKELNKNGLYEVELIKSNEYEETDREFRDMTSEIDNKIENFNQRGHKHDIWIFEMQTLRKSRIDGIEIRLPASEHLNKNRIQKNKILDLANYLTHKSSSFSFAKDSSGSQMVNHFLHSQGIPSLIFRFSEFLDVGLTNLLAHLLKTYFIGIDELQLRYSFPRGIDRKKKYYIILSTETDNFTARIKNRSNNSFNCDHILDLNDIEKCLEYNVICPKCESLKISTSMMKRKGSPVKSPVSGCIEEIKIYNSNFQFSCRFDIYIPRKGDHTIYSPVDGTILSLNSSNPLKTSISADNIFVVEEGVESLIIDFEHVTVWVTVGKEHYITNKIRITKMAQQSVSLGEIIGEILLGSRAQVFIKNRGKWEFANRFKPENFPNGKNNCYRELDRDENMSIKEVRQFIDDESKREEGTIVKGGETILGFVD